jgi:hypothetical protein
MTTESSNTNNRVSTAWSGFMPRPKAEEQERDGDERDPSRDGGLSGFSPPDLWYVFRGLLLRFGATAMLKPRVDDEPREST